MRVLSLTHNFPRFEEDYVGSFVLNQYRGFPSDFEVDVICPQAVDVPKSDEFYGIKVKRIKYWFESGQDFFYGSLTYKIKNPINMLKLFSYIISCFIYCKKHIKEYDVIHAHWWLPNGIIAWLLNSVSGKPYVITSHGTDVSIVRKYKFLKPFAQKILEKAAYTNVVSTFVEGIVDETLDLNNVYRRSMPFNSELFKYKPVEQENKIIGFGRLVKRKGFEYLVQGYREIYDKFGVPLEIYGEGPEKENLIRTAKEYNVEDAVRFMGRIEKNKDVPDVIRKARLFVLPSIVDQRLEVEGLGLVLLEAMACGVPIISTNSQGITDVITHDVNGYLVPQKDSRALTEAIEMLLNSPEKRKKYIEEGFKTVEKFSIPTVGREFAELLKKAAGESSQE
ncbi:MAG TPA: glycosyltransferase family 4 protein [candidate division Zixibacteria bacterium]|nr:glycosyltransferase family 4 protein [candidate division Zixibacteria bacterium]